MPKRVTRIEPKEMTLRDLFAAHVAASFIGRVPCNDGRTVGEVDDAIAEGAYCIADAMMKAREKRKREK